MNNLTFETGVHKNSKWTIYNGDCREVLKRVQVNSIDAIVTSPPYWDCRAYGAKPKADGNIAKHLYARTGKKLEGEIGNGCTIEEYLDDIKRVFELCFNVLKKDKFMFINIGIRRKNYELIDISHRIVDIAKKVGFVHRNTAIWIKKNPVPAGKHKEYYLDMGWEYVLIFTKNKPKKINYREYMKIKWDFKCERCKENNKIIRKIRPNYFYSHIGCFGRQRIPKKSHPALFPIEVARFCLGFGTWEGDTILDPFVGSGTTMIEGINQKLNVIGCELVTKLYNNTVTELSNLNK